MKDQLKIAAGPLAVLLLVATIVAAHGPKVSAAATGKIAGIVKLDGTPPHMKGIDMSKDPYCAKYHASDPAHLELVVVGKDGGLENVVLYLSQGLSAAAASQKSSATPVFVVFRIDRSRESAHSRSSATVLSRDALSTTYRLKSERLCANTERKKGCRTLPLL